MVTWHKYHMGQQKVFKECVCNIETELHKHNVNTEKGSSSYITDKANKHSLSIYKRE